MKVQENNLNSIFNKRILRHNIFILICILAATLIIGGIFVTTIFQSTNITNVLRISSIVGIVAIGSTIVLLTGEIDLSVGSIMSLSLVTGGYFLQFGSAAGLILTYLTGLLLGIINGLIVTKGNITSLMVTLGTLSVYGGLANVIARGQATYLYNADAYLWLGKGYIAGLPFPVILFLILSIIFSVFLSYTRTGKHIYFAGANARAALYSGVKVHRIKILAYALSGLCAAAAGPLLSSQTNRITPTQGTGYELSAIAIAVLGGTSLDGGKGNIIGTLLGALTYGFLLNILTLSGIGTYMEQVLKGVLLVAIVMIFENINKRRK
ncbi:MAG: ABC transporter permease [Mahellales bacterium]|jgi:ribose/xylose/arabinose/galactoside ABC-type transport system permease subunit